MHDLGGLGGFGCDPKTPPSLLGSFQCSLFRQLTVSLVQSKPLERSSGGKRKEQHSESTYPVKLSELNYPSRADYSSSKMSFEVSYRRNRTVVCCSVSYFSLIRLESKALSLGRWTFHASPRAFIERITTQLISNWYQSKPCLADEGNAWWLLCQPSPIASTPQRTLLVEWSLE